MKKLLFTLCIASLFFFKINAQTYSSLVSTADSLSEAKNFEASVEFFEKAFLLEKTNKTHLYNAGCAAARAAKNDLAFQWLDAAFEIGWTNILHLKKDTDLTGLYSDPRWNDLCARMQIKVDEIEAAYDKPLQAELLQILEEDQKYRLIVDSVKTAFGDSSPEMTALWKKILVADSTNHVKVAHILDTRGWVGPDLVGSNANTAIFLVIQHSPLPTQEKYLPMMREAVKKGNARGSALALLEDRVLMNNGKKQLYGSQIRRNPETGMQYVHPVEDPFNVDKRRAEVGLGPLADYVRRWKIVWDPAENEKLPLEEKH